MAWDFVIGGIADDDDSRMNKDPQELEIIATLVYTAGLVY